MILPEDGQTLRYLFNIAFLTLVLWLATSIIFRWIVKPVRLAERAEPKLVAKAGASRRGVAVLSSVRKLFNLDISVKQAFASAAVLLTIYVGYVGFVNQTRLAAETATNDEAERLFEIEMREPNIRCLYDNFELNDYEGCLLRVIRTPGEWSKVIFYTEDALWILHKAQSDKRNWGSHYSDDIAYWQDNVSDDRSGMFSYYLLNEHRSFVKADIYMRDSGVKIRNLCVGYQRVRNALRSAGASLTQPDFCASSTRSSGEH
jgi:hypothetical protein